MKDRGGVSAANINNGISGGYSFVGFNNKQVVNKVDSNQAYLPRGGGGLGIGSSSNSGYVKLTLNNDYKASKVEVLINASTSGASASLSSDITVKK